MSDAANDLPISAPLAASTGAPVPEAALVEGTRLDAFEIEQVLGWDAGTVVYRATDHALSRSVAIEEYLPDGLVRRDGWLQLHAASAGLAGRLDRGLRAFIDEARLLAACEHPALVRIDHLFEKHGTAYRVMPLLDGRTLEEWRAARPAGPDEPTLRAWLGALLGAVDAIHRCGRAHGGISSKNILLLSDRRPVLLGPRLAGRDLESDLVGAWMATLLPSGSVHGRAVASDVDRDLQALAAVGRFCITGEEPVPDDRNEYEPLAAWIARHGVSASASASASWYGSALLDALDAAMSPFPEQRPLNVTQFRDWLERGVPGDEWRVAPIAPAGDSEAPAPQSPALPALPATAPPKKSAASSRTKSAAATPPPTVPTAAIPSEPVGADAPLTPSPAIAAESLVADAIDSFARPDPPPIDPDTLAWRALAPTVGSPPPTPSPADAGPLAFEPHAPRALPPSLRRVGLQARRRRQAWLAGGLVAAAATAWVVATGWRESMPPIPRDELGVAAGAGIAPSPSPGERSARGRVEGAAEPPASATTKTASRLKPAASTLALPTAPTAAGPARRPRHAAADDDALLERCVQQSDEPLRRCLEKACTAGREVGASLCRDLARGRVAD